MFSVSRLGLGFYFREESHRGMCPSRCLLRSVVPTLLTAAEGTLDVWVRAWSAWFGPWKLTGFPFSSPVTAGESLSPPALQGRALGSAAWRAKYQYPLYFLEFCKEGLSLSSVYLLLIHSFVPVQMHGLSQLRPGAPFRTAPMPF